MKALDRIPIFVVFLLAFTVFAASCASTAGNDVNPKNGKKARSSSGKYPPAPKAISETELKALDDEDFKIADFEGKVVLINLWATWCGPCLEEMPYFRKLQDKYGDDGFIVVGLNSDEETEFQVREFVKEQKLNYKIGWATPEVTEEFYKISRLPGIPQTLLLNRHGEMTGMFRGGGPKVIETMVENVDKLMAEKSS